MSNDSRYTMFRNYMVNELGISRDDIRQWTVEAVQQETRKIVGQVDVQGIIMRNAKLSVQDMDVIRRIVADALAKELVIKLVAKP